MHRTLLSKMLLLSEKEVRQCLSMPECLQVNREALVALARGTAQVPTRLGIPYYHHRNNSPTPTRKDDHYSPEVAHDHSHHHHHDHPHTHSNDVAPPGRTPPDVPEPNDAAKDWTLFKPAAYKDEVLGIKVVSVRSNNPSINLPLVPATILNLNASTGQVDAVLAATYLTAARTAAGSGLATAHALRQQNNKSLRHLVVFGAGLQAELHVQAIAAALQAELGDAPFLIPKVTIVNRSFERAQKLQEQISSHCLDVQVVLLSDALGVADSLSTTDVIVAATNTLTPLFAPGLIPFGCHINGIGSYTPDMQEVPSRLVVDRCRVWIDTPEARGVGDLLSLTPHHPVQLLGDVLESTEGDDDGVRGEEECDHREHSHDHSHSHSHHHATPTRWSHLDCTFYKAVGTAIQDVMTADLVVRRARALNIGTDVQMG